jgi:hypothetical protein
MEPTEVHDSTCHLVKEIESILVRKNPLRASGVVIWMIDAAWMVTKLRKS